MNLININKKDLMANDINIIFKTKELIHNLREIKNNFNIIFNDFRKKVQSKIEKNKGKLKEICDTYKLQKNDLMTIQIYVPEEKRALFKNIEKFEKYNYKINIMNVEEMIQICERIIEENKNDVIWFVDNDEKLYDKLFEKVNLKEGNIYYRDPTTLGRFLKLISKKLSNDFIKKKCYSLLNIKKNNFNNDKILNISELLTIIKEDLGIIIEKAQINEILDITLNQKDIKEYYMNIKDNIISLNKYIDINNLEEKVINIEYIYRKKISLLIENIKALLLYDYIFYTLIPDKI